MFLSLGGEADVAARAEVQKRMAAWGKSINNPNVATQVSIQVATKSPDTAVNHRAFRTFEKAIARNVAETGARDVGATGRRSYLLAASVALQNILGINKSVSAAIVIDEDFSANKPGQRNAALNALTKAAQRIRQVASENVAAELQKPNSGITVVKGKLTINDFSLSGIIANLSALFEAFKAIDKAA